MAALNSYFTGTISIGAGATSVVGVGSIWTGGNVFAGDTLVVAGHEVTVLEVVDATHLTIEAWPYSAVTAGSSYKIYKNSPLRVTNAQIATQTASIFSALASDGYFYYVDSTETVPDPSLGDDGQYALKPTTSEVWLKTGGIWVASSFNFITSGVMNFSNTTEATGVGTTFGARFAGGVEFAKKVFIAGAVAIGAMTLANAQSALLITATQPTTPVTVQNAVSINITGAGSAAQTNNAFFVSYLAGYTGSSLNRAGQFANANLGTGSILIAAAGANTVTGNIGVNGAATGNTTGLNNGCIGIASNGDINVGVTGISQSVKNSAKNIGVVGSAINTGTSPVQIGGWFSLNQTTVPTVSAALIADNGSQTDPIFRAEDNGTDVFVIADGGTATLTPSAALTAGVNALLITATQPTTYASQQSGVNFQITGAGTSAVISNALLVQYLPGYTGNQQTRAVSAVNTNAGTGNTLVAGAGSNGTIGNFGAFTNASGASATGLNVGNLGSASSGLKNVGVAGVTQVASNSGANIGVFGTSVNTGTGTVHQSAGYFTLNGTAPDNTTPSAALIANNGAQTDPIARFQDNGTDVLSINDGGTITASTNMAASLQSVVRPGVMVTDVITVDFNSANTDNAIAIKLPTGYTRFTGFRVVIFNASASLTAANYGVFPATAGAGQALLAAGTAITVSATVDASANNASSAGLSQTVSYIAANLATPNTIYFRVGTAVGSAATAKVLVEYFPYP